MIEDVRRVVLAMIHRGDTFTAADVARALDQPVASVPVARAVRELADSGALAALGYRRRLAQERTGQGIITRVAYSPKHARPAVAPAVSSTAPTRAPRPRPLGAPPRHTQRLRTLLSSLDERATEGGAAILRAGEHLLAIERLVGARAAKKHAREALGLAETTYRRWTQIARVFGAHPAMAQLVATRPAALAALAAPTCPAELREEAVTRGSLAVGGRRIPLAALRRRDVQAAIAARRPRPRPR